MAKDDPFQSILCSVSHCHEHDLGKGKGGTGEGLCTREGCLGSAPGVGAKAGSTQGLEFEGCSGL